MIFLSTPFCREASDRLNRFGVNAFKIGSGEMNKGSVSSNQISFKMKFSSICVPNEVETGANGNNFANMDGHSNNPAGSTDHNTSDDLEITGKTHENILMK